MLGTWPLKLGGELCGKVKAERSGAYTVVTAEAKRLPGVRRVSLYGGGRELYLGTLMPSGGSMRLRRRFTRRELDGFEPEYAAEAGAPAQVAPPEPERPGRGGWLALPDGTLVQDGPGGPLIALPAKNVRVPAWAKGVVRRINGREYVVFPGRGCYNGGRHH